MAEIIELKLHRQWTISPKLTAWLKLCLALVSVSFAPIFIRFSETDLGANGTVLNRLLIFALFFGTGRIISHQWTTILSQRQEDVQQQEPVTWQQWFLLFAVGISSITTLGLWAISLQYTTVAKSLLLNNLTPVFTSLGAWLFLGKRFDYKFLLGMSIALTGAVTLSLEDLQGSSEHLLGDIYALLSAVFLGVYFLIVEQLRNRFSATTILLWRCTIGSILLAPFVWFREGQLFPTTLAAWLAVIGLGLISEGLGQRLLADCMQQLSSSFIALFLLLEPIIGAMLAWLIFAEGLSPSTWVGFVVILSGIYLAQSSTAAIQE
ncbi:MAG: EamA family transporter [Xenococcaceae cyanobacterium MO_167.B52]|nr:EamA family transporter [Xenococcaceae cyanobacterium MO_167.B52]